MYPYHPVVPRAVGFIQTSIAPAHYLAMQTVLPQCYNDAQQQQHQQSSELGSLNERNVQRLQINNVHPHNQLISSLQHHHNQQQQQQQQRQRQRQHNNYNLVLQRNYLQSQQQQQHQHQQPPQQFNNNVNYRQTIEWIQPELSSPQSNYQNQLLTNESTQCSYQYLIVVDFEATCWEKNKNYWGNPEIIEFPAVVINLETSKIEAEFQQYVKPVSCPQLSEFCTRLTGITQEQVNKGVVLTTALKLFNGWLTNVINAKHLLLPKTSIHNVIGNAAFVTWSDWDFGNCLLRECGRKGIFKPPYFDQWVDLKAIYRKWYRFAPFNFSDALSHIGLKFEGRPHSGIDDARNIARLAGKMYSEGALFSITKDLRPYQMLNDVNGCY